MKKEDKNTKKKEYIQEDKILNDENFHNLNNVENNVEINTDFLEKEEISEVEDILKNEESLLIESLKKTIQEQNLKIQQLLTYIINLKQDNERMEKRNESDVLKVRNETLINVLTKVIEIRNVISHVILSKKTLDDGTQSKQLVHGIEMMDDEILKHLNFYKISPVMVKTGDLFDPKQHESIQILENDKKELSGLVSNVFTQGYKMEDKIIFFAKVSIYKEC
jgi:molecular chaperone GrpE (heat shock protein)